MNERHPNALTRRGWLAAAGAVVLAGTSGCTAGAADAPTSGRAKANDSGARLRLLGAVTLPYRMSFKGSTVGGLSGIDYDPAADRWVAISDDSIERFYTLRMSVSEAGIGGLELLDVLPMTRADGSPYPRHGPGSLRADPESIRFRPATGTLLWTSEGDRRRSVDPFVREMTMDGRHLREFALPAHFRMNPDGDTGPRRNGALEGLALTPDGLGAWAAMENPLLQDGPESDVDSPGAPCRFTLFDIASGKPTRQIAYRPERIARVPIPGFAFADNGVSEILMVDSHHMLVLERGFSVGAGVSLRLFMIDARDASDTLALPSLRSAQVRVVPKSLVADFDHVGLARLDNTEGMTWGPRLASTGQRTLVCVSDDNFNPLQITQFAAFAFTEPATLTQASHKA